MIFTCLLKNLAANYKEVTRIETNKRNTYTDKDKEENVYHLDQRFSTGGMSEVGGGVEKKLEKLKNKKW
jgi:hypothetical protein